MRDYWSCSKFGDWLRGTAKPSAASAQEWREWKQAAKQAHPWRYWLVETALSKLQSCICWPMDRVYDAKYWFVNRFVTRTHALTSRLQRGQWWDLDSRILNCLFDELVEYVEVELAASNIRWDREARDKYKAPFWAIGWFRTRLWRSPEAGMDYLIWAAGLGEDDVMQAHNAREVMSLYHWWKDVRPMRQDPSDESGWTALCEKKRAARAALGFTDVLDFMEEQDETPEVVNLTREVLAESSRLEQRNLDEDTDMLIRLIRIRSGLWT